MFTEIDVNSANIEDIYDFCLDKLDEGMLILKNNSKVLNYLTDKDLSLELNMLAESLKISIRHARFELVQNIILGMAENIHKLAALEIKYFDEYNSLLRTDIYNTFISRNLKKHAFVPMKLKEILDIIGKTVSLSPTNAAFAVKTFMELGEHAQVNNVLYNSGFTGEYIRQIHKRFEANFGMTIETACPKKSENYNFSDLVFEKLKHVVF